MSRPVTMPDLGESVTEGTVTRWLKQVGDPVELDEPLLEVSTDKVDTEIPSPVAGTVLELLVAEDETVEVGGLLAHVGERTAATVEPAATPVAPPEPPPTAASEPPAAAAPKTPQPESPTLVSRPQTPTVPPDAPDRSCSERESPSSATSAPMSRLRRIIAERMTASLRVSAQLTTVQEVDVTRIVRLRAAAKEEFRRREGIALTFLPFFAKAAVEALGRFPALNASISEDGKEVTFHEGVHLSIAVDTPRGLLVPVIRDAQNLGVAGLARRIADVAERARVGTVTADELAGGTFTITNIGSVGAQFDTPILNQPQVAILATGAIRRRPAVLTGPDGEDQIAVRSTCFLPLTYDHRLVDGAEAGRFVSAIRERVEQGDFTELLG